METDETAAEDLAQDAWLAAVENPPGHRDRLRAWLASVVRNKSVQRVRSESRRRAREEERASDEQAADTADLVERMELHQLVVRAVLEMPEPYRAVLVRRFSEEESTAAIAERLRLPEATVRTRLRRGVEKLRQRLRGEMGGPDGSRALFLVALRKLGDLPQAAAPVPPGSSGPATSAAPATPLLLALVMNKAVVSVALATAAVAVVWSLNSGGPPSPQPPVEAHEDARAPADLEPAAGLAEEEPRPAAEPLELAERSAVDVLVDPTPEPGTVAPVEEEPMGEVVIRVEDVHGNPVAQAELWATQWRSVEEPGSSVWWGDDEERYMGESGRDGVVRLVYRKKHATGNEGTRTIANVGFEVTHPDFITYSTYRFDVSEGETVIVLERGSFLIVSGWIGSRDEAVHDVQAHLSSGVDVAPEDWIPIGDGRPSCSRIPPGAHRIYLSHPRGDGTTWYSEVTDFTLEQSEQKELALELVPPRSFRGVLDEDVPRPVTGGSVLLNLYAEGEGNLRIIYRTYAADVAADGSFTFDGLPPGPGEMIGICDGWVSARMRNGGDEPLGDLDEHGQRYFELQQLDPALHEEQPFELAMVPSANAAVKVLDPDGEPIAGARVVAWPNVHWTVGYASLFMERTWQTHTDSDGVALLENMPGEGRTYLGVYTDEGYLMPKSGGDEDRDVVVELVAGETAEVTVRLEPPE